MALRGKQQLAARTMIRLANALVLAFLAINPNHRHRRWYIRARAPSASNQPAREPPPATTRAHRNPLHHAGTRESCRQARLRQCRNHSPGILLDSIHRSLGRLAFLDVPHMRRPRAGSGAIRPTMPRRLTPALLSARRLFRIDGKRHGQSARIRIATRTTQAIHAPAFDRLRRRLRVGGTAAVTAAMCAATSRGLRPPRRFMVLIPLLLRWRRECRRSAHHRPAPYPVQFAIESLSSPSCAALARNCCA